VRGSAKRNHVLDPIDAMAPQGVDGPEQDEVSTSWLTSPWSYEIRPTSSSTGITGPDAGRGAKFQAAICAGEPAEAVAAMQVGRRRSCRARSRAMRPLAA